MIRLAIEKQQKSQDVNMQFHVLNLIDYLFANLLPVPSVFNLIMKYHLQSARNFNNYQHRTNNNLNAHRPRLMSHSAHSNANEFVNLEDVRNGVRNNNGKSSYFDLEKFQVVT